MSAATAVVTRAQRDAFVVSAHRRAVRKATRTLAGGSLLIGAMYWGIFLVITVALPLIVDAAGGEISGGAMVGAEYSARWFAFSLGVVLFAMLLVSHLAAGGTRRALWTGSVRAVLVVGLAYGVTNSVALLVERGIFGALGWEKERLGSALTPQDDWFVVSAAAESLAVAAYMLVAIAIAAGYYSHGVWRGTLLIVPGLVLLALADVTTRTGALDDALTALLEPVLPTSAAVGLPACLVVVAVSAGWLWWQLRTLTLRPTR